jgi:hypothetical protein
MVNPGDPDDNRNAATLKGKEAVLGWFGGLASTRDYTTFEPRKFIAQNDQVVRRIVRGVRRCSAVTPERTLCEDRRVLREVVAE